MKRSICLIGILLVLGLASGCSREEARRTPSPDGTLILVTTVNTSKADPITYLCVKFQITDPDGNLIFEQQTTASARLRWSVAWDGNERVVLDSSDIGAYSWELQPDGAWQSAQ